MSGTSTPQGRRAGSTENGLVFGRPVEDRAFEAVEAGAGLAVGVAIGAAVAGPVGATVGAVVGALGGLATGEVVERAVGLAATTTNATPADEDVRD
jgi:hypothetical protein